MDLFKEMNQSGITVVVITHEKDIATPILFGDGARIKKMASEVGLPIANLEVVHESDYLKAAEAVMNLYGKDVLISKIQKAFSAGLFGIGKNRKFVPTRWSITAVDSIISLDLMEKVKAFPLINEFRVYEHTALDNKWIVLMVPSHWSYEQLEGWYPKTAWNPDENIAIFSDWEGFDGKKTYALTGGCYYSTRLAICEQLIRESRQAAAITFSIVFILISMGVFTKKITPEIMTGNFLTRYVGTYSLCQICWARWILSRI